MCVYAQVYMHHVCTGACEDWNRVLDFLEPDLQVLSPEMSDAVLGPDPGSSARKASDLKPLCHLFSPC